MFDQVIGDQIVKTRRAHRFQNGWKILLETVEDTKKIHVGVDVESFSGGEPRIPANRQHLAGIIRQRFFNPFRRRDEVPQGFLRLL